jgi:exonuclease III
MKLLSWNIQQGGGKRADRIVGAICNHAPDVVALIEYRGEPGKELCRKLDDKGWKYVESTTSTGKGNGLCVVSRTPLLRRPNPPVPPENAVRRLDVDLPAYGFGIGVLHIPGATSKLNEERGAAKTRFWEAVLATAQSRRDEPFIFIGDLNTGARIDGQGFVCAEYFGRMSGELRWIDLWRAFNGNAKEYSWYSKRKGGADRNGFRVDHAFASPALWPRVVGCRYSHSEREVRTSDHSVVLVEIADP